MKLKIEKHPDFIRLAQHFKHIEALAEGMGVEVDDLINENNIGTLSENFIYRNSLPLLYRNRSQTFKEWQQEKSNENISASGLTILT